MNGLAYVSVHLYPNVEIEPASGSGYHWIRAGGVNIHVSIAEDADRLAEAAREVAAAMRPAAMPKDPTG